jgi:tetratricopeptide (TPR) repeat protein
MRTCYKCQQQKLIRYQSKGMLDRGIELANKLIENNLVKKDSREYCDLLKRRGFLYYLKGDINNFLDDVNRSLHITEKEVIDNERYLLEKSNCLGVLGLYYQDTKKDYKTALEYYKEAIEIKKEIRDDIENINKILINIGTLYKETHDYLASENSFIFVLIKTTDKRLKINCHLELGRLYNIQGDILKAKEELKSAFKLIPRRSFINERADCYRELARIAKKEHDKKTSSEMYNKALELYKKHGYLIKEKEIEKEMHHK